MRYREFIEGIRMGARDLAAAPKKQYTIGLEFEVAVKKYDTSGKVSQSKFMRYILSAFTKTVQPAPRSQNEPAMSRDELRSLIKKSVASATQNRNNA